MKRPGEIQRRKRIQRNTPMPKRGDPAKRAREYDRAYSGPGPVDHGDYVRAHGCCVKNDDCGGRVEAAHIRSGGKGRKADACWLVPLCRNHHTARGDSHHEGAVTFERTFGVRLESVARELWQRSPANTGYGCQDCEDEGRVCDACHESRQQEREWLEWRTG